MKVFMTGTSGYIGGAVADALLARGHRVAGLVRSEERARQLEARGIAPIPGTLDETDVLAAAARSADAVIHAAHADHRASAEAILTALAGSDKAFLHTSGAGIVADKAGGEMRPAVYREDTPVHPVPERAPRVALNEYVLGMASHGVRAIVIAPPMIYGVGTGLHAHSIQIPKMIAVAREAGAPQYVGRGQNLWSNVHIADLVSLFLLALERGPAGAFYYAENGQEESMHDIAAAIGRMLGLGEGARSLSIPEAYAVYGEVPVNLSFGSNCRVRADRARAELDWHPVHRLLLDEIEQGAYAADHQRLSRW